MNIETVFTFKDTAVVFDYATQRLEALVTSRWSVNLPEANTPSPGKGTEHRDAIIKSTGSTRKVRCPVNLPEPNTPAPQKTENTVIP